MRLKLIECLSKFMVTAPPDTSCREWFRRFKDGDFSIEGKLHAEQSKKFEDKKLEALLEEDQRQTQEEQNHWG